MPLSRRARWALLLGDVLLLLLFVAEGMREHETIDADNPLLDIAVTSLYYIPVWLLAAWWQGAFPRQLPALRALLDRTLSAWLVAAPLATLVRALALGRVLIPVPFLLVTIGLGAALLLGWRVAFWWWLRRSAPSR